MCVLTRDGRGRFFYVAGRAGAVKGSESAGRGGAHTAYITWLKSYATSEEALICIALSEISKIYSKFIIMITITIIIIIQCCHIGSIWLSWIGQIRECHLNFALPLWPFLRDRVERPSLILIDSDTLSFFIKLFLRDNYQDFFLKLMITIMVCHFKIEMLFGSAALWHFGKLLWLWDLFSPIVVINPLSLFPLMMMLMMMVVVIRTLFTTVFFRLQKKDFHHHFFLISVFIFFRMNNKSIFQFS